MDAVQIVAGLGVDRLKPRNNQLSFGGNPNHDPNAWILKDSLFRPTIAFPRDSQAVVRQ